MPKRATYFLLIGLLLVGGCSSASREPQNLGLQKQELRRYVESGEYDRQVREIAVQATVWIEQKAAQRTDGQHLTVVFDLDDTLWTGWSNLQHYDFGWNDEIWRKWVDAAQAPAIGPVFETYRRARALGVDVVFLTSRPERDRKATERNLEFVGCRDYVVLICRPDAHDPHETTATFKAAERKKLVAAGAVIVATIGDQESDLTGGYAERTFKLPNPFYFTP